MTVRCSIFTEATGNLEAVSRGPCLANSAILQTPFIMEQPATIFCGINFKTAHPATLGNPLQTADEGSWRRHLMGYSLSHAAFACSIWPPLSNHRRAAAEPFWFIGWVRGLQMLINLGGPWVCPSSKGYIKSCHHVIRAGSSNPLSGNPTLVLLPTIAAYSQQYILPKEKPNSCLSQVSYNPQRNLTGLGWATKAQCSYHAQQCGIQRGSQICATHMTTPARQQQKPKPSSQLMPQALPLSYCKYFWL